MPPWKDSTEAMLTIFPCRPAASAFRAKAWQRKNSDFRLTSITSSQSVFGKIDRVGAADDAGIVDQPVDRAGSLPDAVEHRARGRVVAEIAGDRREGAAFGLHQRRRLVHRRAADADHRAAGLGDGNAYALADAGVGAGDDDALAGQAEGGKIRHRSVSSGTGSTSV